MSKVVIQDFYADWCAPCKALMPILEKIVSEDEDVELQKVNVDESAELVTEKGVRSVPTLIISSDKGEERLVGAQGESRILEVINGLK